jgi:quinol monooxygenase YgiN
MVFARVSFWKFKPGQLRAALQASEERLTPAARAAKGFRGRIALQSTEDPDAAIFITLWEGEEALTASTTEVFQEVARTLAPLVDRPPEMRTYRAVVAELGLNYRSE